MSRAVIDAIFNDYGIDPSISNDSELHRFRQSRGNMMFKIGERVRICHGLIDCTSNNLDTAHDGTIGLFGIVQAYNEPRNLNLYKSPYFEAYNFDSRLHVWIKLLPFEKQANMWYPSEKDECSNDGVIRNHITKNGLLMVPAMDLVNYTVMGDHNGDRLFEETKDRELDLKNNLERDPWPEEYLPMWLNADHDARTRLNAASKHIVDHGMIHYSDIFFEFVSLGRKQRWRVHYVMLNGMYPVIIDNDGEPLIDSKDYNATAEDEMIDNAGMET